MDLYIKSYDRLNVWIYLKKEVYMISVDRINQLSHRIFNTSLTEQKISRDSNPFSQSNFQKNILTEDVFESSKKKHNVSFTGINDKIELGTKRIYSIFAGSINDFSKKFYNGIESIKEFYNGLRGGVVSLWNRVQELGSQEVHLTENLKNGYEVVKNVLSYDMGSLVNTREKQIVKMSKLDPHTQVKPMLIESIEALATDMVRSV